MPFNNAAQLYATGTIAPAVFVKLDGTNDNGVVQATAGSNSHGDFIIGISQPGQQLAPGVAGSSSNVAATAANPALQVYGLGDICLLTIGSGGCSPGNPLKSDLNGAGIVASATDDNVGAIALQAGTSGAEVLVQLVNFPYGGATAGPIVFSNGVTITPTLTLSAANIVTDTTTGTKIGTAANQKIGLYGATTVVQPNSTGELIGLNGNAATAANATNMNSNGNLGATNYGFNDVVKALKQIGALQQ